MVLNGSINKPTSFNGEGYAYMKENMKSFNEQINRDI